MFESILNDNLFSAPTAKLPKWFGERPGKRAGDPETPEGEDEVKPDDEEIEEVVVEEVVSIRWQYGEGKLVGIEFGTQTQIWSNMTLRVDISKQKAQLTVTFFKPFHTGRGRGGRGGGGRSK